MASLLKDVSPADLVHAIRAVARGDAMLAPRLDRRLPERLPRGRSPVAWKTYASRLLTKLDLRDRVQLAALAYETGLVRPVGR